MALIGTDLSDDHPVSIQWQHPSDMGYNMCVNCHGGSRQLPFFDGYVECATCHDVHNGSNYDKLLRKPLQGSQICFHCHDK